MAENASRSEAVRRAERHFDLLSSEYDAYSQRRRRYVDTVDEILADRIEALSPCTYLDVGCGTGRLLRTLRDRVPESRGLGIDVAPGMVATCRDAGLEVFQADFLEHWPGAPVDVLVMEFGVFGYIVAQAGLHATLDHMLELVGDRGSILFDVMNPFCVTHGSLHRTVPTAVSRWLAFARGAETVQFDYAVHGQDVSVALTRRRLIASHLQGRGHPLEARLVEYAHHPLSPLLPRLFSSQILFLVGPKQPAGAQHPDR